MSTATIATILLLGVFLVLVFLRVPVVYAIGVASLLDFFYLGINPMQMACLLYTSNGLTGSDFCASSLDNEVAAQTIGQVENRLDSILFAAVDHTVCTQFKSLIQKMCIRDRAGSLCAGSRSAPYRSLYSEPINLPIEDGTCRPRFFAQFRRFFLVQFSESAKKGLTLVVRCVNL